MDTERNPDTTTQMLDAALNYCQILNEHLEKMSVAVYGDSVVLRAVSTNASGILGKATVVASSLENMVLTVQDIARGL